MKKLLSAALALTVAVTSLSCTVLGGFSANAVPTNQPEGAEDLAGKLEINSLEDFQNNFSYADGVKAQLEGVDNLYYVDGETSNYYWKDNGYTAAVNSAGNNGYFTGIDESKLQTVKYTTEFLTAANGYSDFKIDANGKSVFNFAPGATATGGNQVLALRPAAFGATVGSAFAYYVVPFEDSEITEETVYNNAGTSTLSFTSVVKDYYGTGIHAVVVKNTAATNYFSDGKTYYNLHIPARDVDGKICQYPNNTVSNIRNYNLGGMNVKASLTFTKEDGVWYATKVELTVDDLCDFAPYKGLNGEAKLYFNGNAAPYTVSYTGKQEIGTSLKVQLPSHTIKVNAANAQNNMYLKNASFEYTEDPTYYLADFNAAYTAMTDAGITAESTSVTADDYNTYVAPVWAEYNALNAFLKPYVDEAKMNTLEAVDYVYYVGDKADAFNAAYDKIKNLDAASMTFDELTAAKPDIDACRTEYNKLSADIIKYIPSEKLAKLVSLENAYNGYVERKESGTFYADFEDNTGSNAALSTYFLNKTFEEGAEDGITKSVIYANANQDFGTGCWISGYIPDATAANGYASPSSKVTVKDGKATQLINNIKSETSMSDHKRNIERSILTTVNNDYLPNDINKISFTADISDLSETVTSKEYVSLYGKNRNFTVNNADTIEKYTDAPVFGTAVKIDKDGNVTFGIAYYTFETSKYDSSVRLNHIVTNYGGNSGIISTGNSSVANTNVTKPGDFSTKTVDVSSGKFNLEISFAPYTFTTSVENVYATTSCYVPTYTMVDGTGNKLVGTPYKYPWAYDNNNGRRWNANIFVTDIYGVAFGLTTENAAATKQELVLDDIYVQGNGANAVTGATILNNNTPSKQDLKFNATLSESDYLKGEGYTVAGYGAVAAVEGQFQNANLSELTVETAEALGAGKAFKYEKEANTVPSNLGVVLGNSAAVQGGIGLQYRVRVYVKYVRGEEVKYVYSTNRAEGLMENGQHVRSVYSTAKAIANYVKSSGSATYASLGEGNEAAFETAITNIIAGAKSTEKQTVGTELDNGTILLSFTSENAGIIKGN